jgi:hypothetical protein
MPPHPSPVTSVPVMPMAMPMSASLSAGASFTPSPVMAAVLAGWALCCVWRGWGRAGGEGAGSGTVRERGPRRGSKVAFKRS